MTFDKQASDKREFAKAITKYKNISDKWKQQSCREAIAVKFGVKFNELAREFVFACVGMSVYCIFTYICVCVSVLIFYFMLCLAYASAKPCFRRWSEVTGLAAGIVSGPVSNVATLYVSYVCVCVYLLVSLSTCLQSLHILLFKVFLIF